MRLARNVLLHPTNRPRLGRAFGWNDLNPFSYVQRGYSAAWDWYSGNNNNSDTNTQVPLTNSQPAPIPIYIYFDNTEEEAEKDKLKVLEEEVTLSFKTTIKLLKKYVWLYPRYSWRVASQTVWVFVEKYIEFALLLSLLFVL